VAGPASSSYVELHVHSAYSFLDGASQPEELVARAIELGYEAMALTDHNGLYGSLEFAQAAKALGLRPITGCELTLEGGSHVTVLVETRRGYSNLCRLVTRAHAHTRPQGRERELRPPALPVADLMELSEGLVCLSGCARHGLGVRDPNTTGDLARAFGPGRFLIELQRPYERGDEHRNAALRELAADIGVETVATGDVHAHCRRRTLLQDVLVAIRENTSLEGCEQERRGNHESVLLSPGQMAERFFSDPGAVERAGALAERLEFDLTEELGYRYPDFSDEAEPAIRRLSRICERAFAERYPPGARFRRAARGRLDEELRLIEELGLAGFFCLHHEVLELAREVAREVRGRGSPRSVLPPGRGRGSSVGSLVCYLTGLSHVDPVACDLSLGRFLNREMAGVPDIDLDFPRDIREQLIVRIVERYGHEHAALVASFPTYRARGAIRDVGRALGLPQGELERLARLADTWDAREVADEMKRLPDAERKLGSKRWRAFAHLTAEIARLPRHVSQHPGGMVISSCPLVELVPVMPAAMPGRQICQWDKDSCADAGFMKIDLLGLGMLSAVEACVDEIARLHGEPIDLSRIPLDDAEVYAEIQRADTVGSFQIESRAQMQSLPQTLPQNLDDLTIQVALVRPGPIQGKAIHPYIEHRRRLREDPSFQVPYDHPLLEEPLRETLGVVVFQDQVLEVAMALAGFSVGEAEGLRRAMSRKRSAEALEAYRQRFIEGAVAKGVDPETADRVYDKLSSFSGFGFPKSHAAAFALLGYQSAWLRHHYPAEYLCSLLNAQPMGFYSPAALVRDAQRRGLTVLPVDVNASAAQSRVEGGEEPDRGVAWRSGRSETKHGKDAGSSGMEKTYRSNRGRSQAQCFRPQPTRGTPRAGSSKVRIGLLLVKALGETGAKALVEERERGGAFADVCELAQRSGLDERTLSALVQAGACDSFGEPRRALLWELGLAPRDRSVPGSGGKEKQLTLQLPPTVETPALPEQSVWERLLSDYRSTGLSTGVHPLELLRSELPPGTLTASDLPRARSSARVSVAGMVVARQRPPTANGVTFLLLEDETGQLNVIVMPPLYAKNRALVRGEPILLAHGRLQRSGGTINVIAEGLRSLVPLARRLSAGADVHGSLPGIHSFH
jgi:error-prone DNA polymerase